ncbi:MAG TPA: multiheme c-type cytochrome [Gemmatimonadales bacterium]|nr:multiheme c-type cytochrome [Gemmatimonadales bacterium]
MRLHRLIIVAAFGLGACTTEQIQYITRPFVQGGDKTNGFLGYFTVSAKQTNCGNCHVGVQAAWITTKHAQAWSDLQNSGHAQSTCSNCHSVSQLGNGLGHPGGYAVVADSAYQDVQCESCHGPGFTHASSPTLANVPLASIHVDTNLANGCGGCHTGVHEPFVDQWVQSAHGSGPGYSHAATNASCAPCHEGKAALAIKFGVVTNYKEKSDTTHQRIVCVVCHDPHGASPFEGQLRADISAPTTDNLCIKCHSRTGTPPWGVATATSAARGPHGAQGLLVIGQNVGWIPPNFTYDTSQIVSSHGSAANTRLCATCHVAFTTITDAKTGAFQFQSVGHLFEAIPCTNATTGIPVPCATAVAPDTVRSFVACSNSTCHIGGPQIARNAFLTFRARLDNLLDQIWTDSNGNGVIDSAGVDAGLLPQLVARAMRSTATHADSLALRFDTTVTTVAKGTLFNAALAATSDRPQFASGRVLGKSWAAHMSAGEGVHNPFLLEALLTSSISALQTTYGLAPPIGSINLSVQAIRPPGVRTRAGQR